MGYSLGEAAQYQEWVRGLNADPTLLEAVESNSGQRITLCLRGDFGRVSQKGLEDAYEKAKEVGNFKILERFVRSKEIEKISAKAINGTLLDAARQGEVGIV